MFTFALVVVLTLVGIAVFVYLRLLFGHMTIASTVLGKPDMLAGTSGFTWLSTKLLGWKTIILGWLAALSQAVSFLLASDLSPWKDLPWEKLFSERVSNYITFGIVMLMTVTHAQGFAKAASTPPQD